jgi:hypothetical protein
MNNEMDDTDSRSSDQSRSSYISVSIIPETISDDETSNNQSETPSTLKSTDVYLIIENNPKILKVAKKYINRYKSKIALFLNPLLTDRLFEIQSDRFRDKSKIELYDNNSMNIYIKRYLLHISYTNIMIRYFNIRLPLE